MKEGYCVDKVFQGQWGLILGASSGFGLAAAKALAARGMNIFGVHFDRRSAMEKINQEIAAMKSQGVEVEYFNSNAADAEKRQTTLAAIQEKTGGKPLKVLLHSVAFGTLKPYYTDTPDSQLTQKQMEMTLDVMANSLVYWAQDLANSGLLGKDSRIYAMTSSGSKHVWANYGAVSAAKAALEAHIRQLAVEMAPLGIKANAICAGVTDTPALRKIPRHENMVEEATRRNPSGRLTTPEDVANAICALTLPETAWITGNVIYADGGEEIAG